jgi:hypothetical protein
MELLVATWTLRLALVGALAVAGISLSAGAPVIDAVDRAVIAAFAFTVLGRKVIGWLETPQQRMLRLRARREAAAGGKAPATKQKRAKNVAAAPQAMPASETAASPTP